MTENCPLTNIQPKHKHNLADPFNKENKISGIECCKVFGEKMGKLEEIWIYEAIIHHIRLLYNGSLDVSEWFFLGKMIKYIQILLF